VEHIDLSQNHRLQHLTIHISLRRFHSSSAGYATWALLSALRAPLSTLTIVLKFDTIDVFENLDWAHLNENLQTHPYLSALNRLHFIVHCSSGAMDEVEGALRGRMAAMHGRLDISVVHTSRVFTHGRFL
jgi:hypothetical protein